MNSTSWIFKPCNLLEVLIILLLTILLGFVIQGVLGYGFAAVVFPILLINGFEQPTFLTVLLQLIVSSLFGYHYFQKDKLPIIGRLLLFSILGVLLGIALKQVVINQKFLYYSPLVISVVILLIVHFSPKQFLDKINNPKLLGGLSGLMTNWSGIGGPPIVIYALSNQKKYVDIKSLIFMYFVCLYGFAFITMQVEIGFNYWSPTNLQLLGSSIVFILILKYLYNFTSKRLDNYLNNHTERFKNISVFILMLICLMPIIKDFLFS